jgi:hypothetical protein
MAELITGDRTKGIKSVGELALRISKFDSYRLFTLYENVKERKVMDVSGDQKYYLVFKSPKKEIRIPEYDPKGFFEVDKVNGCILFKITKKNAEDILGMRNSEKIFHIIRVFEERDKFGKVLSVTDEVEVYNGKWGDDYDFGTFNTNNKVDLLTKAVAVQVDKNANMLNEYNDLLGKYNDEIKKSTELEKELEGLRTQVNSLTTQLDEYTGSTYDGTILSTDTKYIAFENTLDNISFTEEAYSSTLKEAMSKDSVDLSDYNEVDDRSESQITLAINVANNIEQDLKVTVFKNGEYIGDAINGENFNLIVDSKDRDQFKFECVGEKSIDNVSFNLKYEPIPATRYKNVIRITDSTSGGSDETKNILAIVNYDEYDSVIGNVGTLTCSVG